MRTSEKFRDLVDRLREDGFNDYADELEPYVGSSLVNRVDRMEEKVEQAEGLETERDELLGGAEKRRLLEEVGLPWEKLRPLEKRQVLRSDLPSSTEGLLSWAEENEVL